MNYSLTFPIFYQLNESIILFYDYDKCLRVTNDGDTGIEISEQQTKDWLWTAVNIGHQVTQKDFAWALMKATSTIETYYKKAIPAHVNY